MWSVLYESSALYPDNGDSRFLGKIDSHLPNYTVLHSRNRNVNYYNGSTLRQLIVRVAVP
jgi:hypothetical protein